MKNKQPCPFPQINLKGGDVFQEFNVDEDATKFELVIEYKRGNVPRDFINPVSSIEIFGGILYVTNTISEYHYKYGIKDIKRAFLVPMEIK